MTGAHEVPDPPRQGTYIASPTADSARHVAVARAIGPLDLGAAWDMNGAEHEGETRGLHPSSGELGYRHCGGAPPVDETATNRG